MKCRGFTLIELIVALAVLSIVVGAAAPALMGAVRSARSTGAMSDLTVAMAVARMEAIRRNAPVTLCPSSDGNHCTRNTAWETGWIVFSDPARTAAPAAETDVLQRFEPIAGGLLARTTQGRTYIRFQPSGWSSGTNLSIRLCDAASNRLMGAVILNNSGRSRVERPARPAPCPFRG